MATEAERAAAYREEQRAIVAKRKALAELLKGNSAARSELQDKWQPLVKDRN